jgi:cell division protein FtsW
MASIVGSSGPSAAQRRRATLDRKGYSEKRRLATEAPNNIFYGILVVSSMLIVFGLIMVLSSSSIVAINTGGSPWNMFRKQATWATFGLFALFSTYRMPYHTWHKLTKPVLAFAFGLMALPFVPGVGITTNGARAWAQLGPIRFQPSEVLKVAVLLYCASVLGRRRAEISDFRRTFRPVMYVWLGAAAACLLQKDFGAAIVFTCIILATLFIAGTPLRLIAAVLSVTLLGSTILIASSTRMQNRFLSFMDIEGNKGHYAYQVWQSILSIANGGVAGVGAGQGTVGLCPASAQRLYFRNCCRGVRSHWRSLCNRWFPYVGLSWNSSRARRTRSFWRVVGWRNYYVALHPGLHQYWRRNRGDACYGLNVAAYLVWRIFAVYDDGRSRTAA